ncbi:MAG: tRNA (adenosine(37)-N6)-dimethylallyltransferase MiaA [Clostridia bacterium]|nr:tRNA (adenosine(37)-N6)-dimethylallyltransferase MiaA [Clostridia bacterium]
MPQKVLVICGATASGKTRLAVDCALKLNTEIISADSQLIYKGLNIGTAKPNKEEMCGVKHHMIDVVEPTESFSVSDYSERALPILEKLLSEGKTPIICGGTGFYINSLLFDLGYGNAAADETVREKYADFLEKNGRAALFDKLKEVDPETAAVLHPNDVKRVIRALEIYEVSGKKKSAQNDNLVPKYDFVAVAINYPREELYERINRRVDEMFNQGLVEEVQSLLQRGIDENCQCMQAIGYKEVVFGLNNNNLRSTMSDIIKQNTRHYAKRQITFFKKMPNLVCVAPEEATAERIAEILNETN